MKRLIIILICLLVALFVAVQIRAALRSTIPQPIPTTPQDNGDAVACTMDAMMCPDGTYVGRTGLKCEFVCPPVQATTTMTSIVTLGINDTFIINGTIIKPLEVTQDSRCPANVVCIQAGKVVVKVSVGNAIVELESNQTKSVGGLSVTLDDVKPSPVTTHKISPQEYSFSFTIKGN
jgi:hypothetical protein